VHPCVTRRFCVLIRRRNRPRQSDSENGIRPVRLSVCDHWTHRKVSVDAEKSDGARVCKSGRLGPARDSRDSKKENEKRKFRFPFSVFRACVCPTQRFRVLIRPQNRFWILGLGFFSRGSKGGNKGPRERERSSASSGCLHSDVRRCLQFARGSHVPSLHIWVLS